MKPRASQLTPAASRPKLAGVGSAADGDEDAVGADRLAAFALDDAGFALEPGAEDLRAEVELEALALENAVGRAGQVGIDFGEDAVHGFEDGDTGAEPGPNGAHFEADVAAADDHEMPGYFGVRERVGTGTDGTAEIDAGYRRGATAGGDEEVPGGEGGLPGGAFDEEALAGVRSGRGRGRR